MNRPETLPYKRIGAILAAGLATAALAGCNSEERPAPIPSSTADVVPQPDRVPTQTGPGCFAPYTVLGTLLLGHEQSRTLLEEGKAPENVDALKTRSSKDTQKFFRYVIDGSDIAAVIPHAGTLYIASREIRAKIGMAVPLGSEEDQYIVTADNRVNQELQQLGAVTGAIDVGKGSLAIQVGEYTGGVQCFNDPSTSTGPHPSPRDSSLGEIYQQHDPAKQV